MKSPLYILTVLLPLALAIPAPEPDVGAESIEERKNGNDNNRNRCSKNSQIPYYRYPCDGSDRMGSYRNNEHVEYICKYKGWYRTGNNWWVKGGEKPRDCDQGNRNCF